MSFIRPPAVAGQFYPAETNELSSIVQSLLDNANSDSEVIPKALIAPHAGLIYSGPIAASAYNHIRSARNIIKRVLLLGPCHRVAVRGLALSGADAFETPLGNIEIDKKAMAEIIKMPYVHVFDKTHESEHSLEVHLPFLQRILDHFELIPIVVGETPEKAVAEVLQKLWGGPETLVIISSDLSHYKSYQDAQKIDTITCNAIENLNPVKITPEGACGRFPISGLLNLAQTLDLKVSTLDIRNSGDTAGPKDRVVGYGSWMFTEPIVRRKSGDSSKSIKNNKNEAKLGNERDFEQETKRLLEEYGTYLLLLASASIEHGIKFGQPATIGINRHPKYLKKIGACFVTLKKSNQLRGCIGSPIAHRPLALDIIQNAYNAAFNDPRFPKLEQSEFDDIEVSISVLSPATPINLRDENDLLSQLRPFIDGLIIEDMGKQSLFLPSVWQQLPSPKDFLQRLKSKAGLNALHWSETFSAKRFIAEEISMSEIFKETK